MTMDLTQHSSTSLPPAYLDPLSMARALGGEVSAGQIRCPGPGHSPKDRSLSIKIDPTAPEGFLVNSFSGDDPAECRDHVRQQLGLPEFQAKKPNGNGGGNGSGAAPWKFISEHIYKTETGEPYLRVQKYLDENGKKQFPQSHWDGKQWIKGKPEGPKIPYRLPQLIAAPLNAPVKFCEGEKDCDALEKLGFISTTASEGAHATWDPAMTQWFKDRPVVILPDADKQGRKHAEKVAAALNGVAASVKVVDLFPNQNDGADVSDWLKGDLAGSRLAKLVKDADEWEAPKDSGGGSGASGGKADAALIDGLAALAPLQYERRREQAAEQLDVRISVLDGLVAEARGERSASARRPPPAPDPDELKCSAAHIIENENILDLFAKEFSKVIAGETANGKLLYLIATSRLLPKTMNAAIKGTSAGGKSEVRKRILEFFPSESIFAFTSLSEKSLIYYDGDFSHKILSMGEATATDEQDFQDYLLRELMSEGRISYPTVQKVGNELVTQTIEKEGPVAFMVTTTKNTLHPENETRMLSLEIDDSEKQTRSVLRKVAQVEGLNESATLVDVQRWQDFQRWLELGTRSVVVPFAIEMVELIPAAAGVRLRRDAGQVIRAIQAHAIIHREHRNRDAGGRIIADIEHDYEVVRELMHDILAESSGVAVKKAMNETIEAVKAATAGLDEAEGAPPSSSTNRPPGAGC
jgi:5S rRNA maturation endonuclease (ribonuclease M5)